MEFNLTAAFFAVLTVSIYLLTNILYLKYRKTLLNPVLASTAILVLILVLGNIPYDTYMMGGNWIGTLLGPAVVALAIPLYKQRDLLFNNMLPILSGIAAGVVVGMASGILFTQLFRFSEELILTVLPKSLTTPVAMQVASNLGGIPSLAAVFVMVAGFTGYIFGPALLKWLHIDSPIGRGIGLGTSAHGMGTAKAFEYGQQEASMSSVAMTLSAVFGALLGPVAAWLLLL
ncbi:LrgB family protein [Microbacterium sp. APC 3898]|uniref:LrgB family protein n=1 Tax=Planococcus notacanthi TaxID=3035188 RepID=A0ABT7ZL93_9BACL|nr:MULTISPECIES: LrgB family protein [Terrabacteria group]MDN3427935.1 LrgB family protein [Planococcus sp. APC 4016]MDN3439112.1 LrgB family protein [Planococcus sp. APC 3900]MDN3498530.1 LrgB family protein [Microbacterium sp. APC 3898]